MKRRQLGLLRSMLATACVVVALPAHAADASLDDVCAAPTNLIRLSDPLPRTRALLASGRPLRIVALGSSSTGGTGASSVRFTYPSRLEAELAQRFPAAPIEVINRGINGEDAWENIKRLDGDVLAAKPDLVIWQMGTNAVLHDVDYDDFDRAVQSGLDRLRAANVEVLLMDLQYAPRVDLAPGHARMLADLDAIGARNHLPVFHRYALMSYWASRMSDYASMIAPDGLHMDDRSYGCLAQRLADAIVGDLPVPGSRGTTAPAITARGANARSD